MTKYFKYRCTPFKIDKYVLKSILKSYKIEIIIRHQYIFCLCKYIPTYNLTITCIIS